MFNHFKKSNDNTSYQLIQIRFLSLIPMMKYAFLYQPTYTLFPLIQYPLVFSDHPFFMHDFIW